MNKNSTAARAFPLIIETSTATNLLYLDSLERIGINTNVPAEELEILSSAPAIRLNDSSSSSYDADITLNSYEFAIEGNADQDIIEMDTRAPVHSLHIRSNGNVGIGAIPSSLDVNGDVQIRGDGVANAVGTEHLLRLEGAVPPEMGFKNATSGALWFFAMTSDDEFKVSFDGTGKVEARFYKNGNMKIAGTLTENSDRDSKKGIVAVDSKKVLETVANVPISTWEYKADEGVSHMGPMAQDFYAAFGLGNTPKGISTVDTGGVALAAIKGLNEVVKMKEQEINTLKLELAELKELVYALAAKDKVTMNQ